MDTNKSSGIPPMIYMGWTRSDFLNNSTNGSTLTPLGLTIAVEALRNSGARGIVLTRIPTEKKASLIWLANHCVSTSGSNAMLISTNLPFRSWINSNCSWFNTLGNNLASSSMRANSAFEARSLASAARTVASATLLFDRLRNSVWMRASILPQRTSPTIPSAIALSAIADPHCSRDRVIWRMDSRDYEFEDRLPRQLVQRSAIPNAHTIMILALVHHR